MSTPIVPARPSRKLDTSPHRSPLNAHYTVATSKPQPSSKLAAEDAPARPPSVVALPVLGLEGSEYATYDQLPPEAHGVKVDKDSGEPAAPEHQTRNIAEDMMLHAPKASLPQSTAKSRIETVTRTDSTQAAAAGIGKARPDDDVHNTPADSNTSLTQQQSQSDDLSRVISSSSTLKPKVSRPREIVLCCEWEFGNHFLEAQRR